MINRRHNVCFEQSGAKLSNRRDRNFRNNMYTFALVNIDAHMGEKDHSIARRNTFARVSTARDAWKCLLIRGNVQTDEEIYKIDAAGRKLDKVKKYLLSTDDENASERTRTFPNNTRRLSNFSDATNFFCATNFSRTKTWLGIAFVAYLSKGCLTTFRGIFFQGMRRASKCFDPNTNLCASYLR